MRRETESFAVSDMSWLGSTHGLRNSRTGTLKASSFTPATHYPNGYLPSGLAVNAADEGDILPYTGAEGEVLGFLLTDQLIKSSEDTFAAPVFRHGTVNVSKLPVDLPAGTADAHFVLVEGD